MTSLEFTDMISVSAFDDYTIATAGEGAQVEEQANLLEPEA